MVVRLVNYRAWGRLKQLTFLLDTQRNHQGPSLRASDTPGLSFMDGGTTTPEAQELHELVYELDLVAPRYRVEEPVLCDIDQIHRLDLDLLAEQHAAFVDLLTRLGCGVEVLAPADDMPDAIFTYDPAFVAPSGVIELRAAKAVRAGEPPLLTSDLEALGVPRVGRLSSSATADGGEIGRAHV